MICPSMYDNALSDSHIIRTYIRVKYWSRGRKHSPLGEGSLVFCLVGLDTVVVERIKFLVWLNSIQLDWRPAIGTDGAINHRFGDFWSQYLFFLGTNRRYFWQILKSVTFHFLFKLLRNFRANFLRHWMTFNLNLLVALHFIFNFVKLDETHILK